MFDFLRNLGRSEEELKQDALSAYLDDSLTPAERERLERQLAQDSDLQEQLAEMRFWQQQMRALPARRVPRNFTLDPALYGRPQRRPLAGAYPVLRTATALTAFLFVIALAANVYLGGFATQVAPQADTIALIQSPVEEAAPIVETAKIEMETAVEAEAETAIGAEESPMEEAAAVEEIVEESAVAEQAGVAEGGAAESAAAPSAVEAADAGEPMPPGLLSMQGTGQPPPAVGGGGTELPLEPAPAPAEELAAEAAPILETAVPAAREMVSPAATMSADLPQTMDEGTTQPITLLPGGVTPFLLALGFLFVILLVLTFLARPR